MTAGLLCRMQGLLTPVRPYGVAAFVTILYATLAIALVTPGSDIREVSLSEAHSGFEEVLQPSLLPRYPGPAGENIHRLTLAAPKLGRLFEAETISLLFATYHDDAELIQAQLVLGGSTCVFYADPNARLADNKHLTFRRRACAGDTAEISPTAELIVHSRGAPNLAIWTTVFSGAARPEGLLVTIPTGEGPATYVRGSYMPPPAPPASRMILLAHVWQVDMPLLAALLFSFYLVVLWGASQVWRHALSTSRGKPSVLPLGAALLFFGLCGTYAVIIPPFQAPDEPDHFLGLAEQSQSSELAADALRLSQIGHFERIKFRGAERFTAVDMTRPLDRPWAPHVGATRNETRSALAHCVSGLLGRMLRTSTAGTALLTARLLNSCFLALILALALFLGKDPPGSAFDGTVVAATVLAVLHAPTLPFFGMHVSNYVFLIGAFLLQVTGLVAARHGLTWKVAALIGLGIAVGLGAGVGGFAAAAFWCITLTAWAVLLPRRADMGRQRFASLRQIAVVAVGAGILMFLAITHNYQFPWVVATLRQVCSQEDVSGLLCVSPGVVSAAALGIGLALTWIARRAAQTALTQKPAWRKRLIKAFASLVLLVGLVSFLSPTDGLPTIEGAERIGLVRYIRKAVTSFFLAGVGFAKPEFYTVSSFWGGFAWLETLLPDPLIWALKTVPSAGVLLALIGVIRRQARHPSGPQALRDTFETMYLLSFVAALAGYVAVLALGSWSNRANLHGRYMIGAYLFHMGVGFAALLASGSSRSSRLWFHALLAGQGAVHLYALVYLLRRYF